MMDHVWFQILIFLTPVTIECDFMRLAGKCCFLGESHWNKWLVCISFFAFQAYIVLCATDMEAELGWYPSVSHISVVTPIAETEEINCFARRRPKQSWVVTLFWLRRNDWSMACFCPAIATAFVQSHSVSKIRMFAACVSVSFEGRAQQDHFPDQTFY